ncbi:MAG: hypothetical protein F6K63_35880, partial [Moorea sp. SIO1G6]|uniref:hypothetical protein n=1 Tax=Moorena sp. SIO1G6 TaxID=2607840 RepID=UPI0013C2913B
ATDWQRGRVKWYNGKTEVIDWVSDVSFWYSTGTRPLLLRWVLVRDPSGVHEPVAFFSTDIHQAPRSIIASFVKRWAIEVTFEVGRAHLGIETQRQWSDNAIERTTPALFGIFSIVVLMVYALFGKQPLPLPQAAWYPKSHATFHDIIAILRCHLWQHLLFQTPADSTNVWKCKPPKLRHLLSSAIY